MKKLLFMVSLMAVTSLSAQELKVGELSNITRLTSGTERYENPSWSPDGKKIALTKEGYNCLYLMNPDGKKLKQISDATGVGYMYQWSADSKEILVRDTRWEGEKRLHAAWAINQKGKKVKMTEDAEYMQPGAWRYNAEGAKSVMVTEAPQLTTSLSRLPRKALTDTKALANSNVSFVADGVNLYVINNRGERIKINDGASFCPVLSPDGSMVAFNQVENTIEQGSKDAWLKAETTTSKVVEAMALGNPKLADILTAGLNVRQNDRALEAFQGQQRRSRFRP